MAMVDCELYRETRTYMKRTEIPTNAIKRLESRLNTLGGNKICPLCYREIEGRFYVLSCRMQPTHKIGD